MKSIMKLSVMVSLVFGIIFVAFSLEANAHMESNTKSDGIGLEELIDEKALKGDNDIVYDHGVINFPSDNKNTPPIEEIAKEDKYGINGIVIYSTQFLKTWGTSIYDSSGRLKVAGFTKSYSSVDTIGVKLYLQIWNSSTSKWVDLNYAGDFNKKSVNQTDSYKYFSVQRGYYYRTKGIHYVTKSGKRESVTTYSDYIYAE